MQDPERSFWFLLLMEHSSTELGQGLLPAPWLTLGGCVFCWARAAQCWVIQYRIGFRHIQGHREAVAGQGAQRASCPGFPQAHTRSLHPWQLQPVSLCPKAHQGEGRQKHKPQAQKKGHPGLFSMVCPRRAWAPMSRCDTHQDEPLPEHFQNWDRILTWVMGHTGRKAFQDHKINLGDIYVRNQWDI